MPPDQNQPNQNNGYDFILNQQAPKKMNSFFDGSIKSLAIMAGAGIFVIIIIFMIFSAMKPKGIAPSLLKLSATQGQIASLSAMVSNETTTTQSILNLGANANLVLMSEQAQLNSLLATSGIKLPDAKNIPTDSESTQQLTLANQAGNFDEVYVKVLTNKLTSYQISLKSIYAEAKGEKLKTQLKDDYANAALLLKQAKNVNSD